MKPVESNRRRDFDRRSLLILGLNGCFLAVVAERLYQLQILEHEQYAVRSDENRVKLQLLVPPRGRIFDRNGVLLAGNRWHHYLHVVPPRGEEGRRAMMLRLEHILQPSSSQYTELHEIFRRTSESRDTPHRLVRLHSWEDVTKVASHSVVLPGVSVRRESERHYPAGEVLAHLLGYVSSVTSDDISRNEVLAHLSNYQIGRVGFEQSSEAILRGKIGTLHVEVNAHGKSVRNLREKKALPGKDLRLTVDYRLQRYTASLLAGETGAAVLLDTVTGEALACCSSPSFDPNLFVTGLDHATWDALSNSPTTPLVDRSVRGRYAPGSTFKVVVALAALEAGHDPNHTVFCGGVREIGGNRFHCWRRQGHGRLALTEAIAQSCDLHFYELALNLGVDRIAAMARRLGLGAATTVDESVNERAGLVPTKAWKKEVYNKSWYQSDTANVGIGQGYLLATPVQLALMTARIASGRELGVRFVQGMANHGMDERLTGTAPPDFGAARRLADALDIEESSLAFVRNAMSAVVNSPTGTARDAGTERDDFLMAGKTGTVQVRRITAEERKAGVKKNEDLPWRFRDHALFVGFAPVEQPRYAVAVVVEHGGSGSRVAAPIARDLLLEAQRLGVTDGSEGAGQIA